MVPCHCNARHKGNIIAAQFTIGTRTGGAGEQVLPNKIIGGTTSTSCSPIFFCNLQLKVTLHTLTLLLTQKLLKISRLLGALPQTPLYMYIPFSKNTYCTKLYFELNCLVLHQFLLP